MATIRWASDLHLDHLSPAGRTDLADRLARATGPALLITGDISNAPRVAADLEFLADAAGTTLYHVLGNHDHYGASIAAVRDSMLALSARRADIQWLPPAGVMTLDETTALIGVDGWADGRHGDPLATPLVLNDDRLIAELAAQPTRRAKLAVKQALADADAARLAVLLERAAATAKSVIVATHIPPFVEALPFSGRLADPDWQPILVCGATGDVLRQFAVGHPDHSVTVLCGHSHVEMDVTIAPNLRCRVMGARYGEATVTSIRV